MIRGAIGDVVDEVLIVGVGEFLGVTVVDFRKDDRRKRGGLGSRGGNVLSEYRGAVCDTGATK